MSAAVPVSDAQSARILPLSKRLRRDRVELWPETATDAPFIERLYAALRADELAATDWPEEVRLTFLRQQLRLQRDDYRNQFPGCELLIIARERSPIGRLYLSRSPAEYRILELSLLPAARGGGIGGELVRAIQADARAAHCPVTLHVERNNAARRLYARLGFQLVGPNGAYDFIRWAASPPR